MKMSEKNRSKSRAVVRVRVECFMLCDFAREENGKLYIVGGGWNRLQLRQLPTVIDFYIAIKLMICFQATPGPIDIVLEMINEDGNLVSEPAALNVTPESSKSLSARAEHPLFLSLPAQLTIQKPGRYSLRLLINGEAMALTAFQIDSASTTVGADQDDPFGEVSEPAGVTSVTRP